MNKWRRTHRLFMMAIEMLLTKLATTPSVPATVGDVADTTATQFTSSRSGRTCAQTRVFTRQRAENKSAGDSIRASRSFSQVRRRRCNYTRTALRIASTPVLGTLPSIFRVVSCFHQRRATPKYLSLTGEPRTLMGR